MKRPTSGRPGSALPLFSFSQVELPWALGPPDGRYLVRRPGDPADAPPEHVLLFATLGAPERRRLDRRRRRVATPEPPPAPVVTGRATVIAAEPLPDRAAAARWLQQAGEQRLAGDLAVLNRALHAFRLVSADPYRHAVERSQLLLARVGYGEGEEVAAGRWTEARELLPGRLRGRRRMLEPQARLAGVLAGREPLLACAELALRARLDVDQERFREAALQLLVALDAALAELDVELADRVQELRERRRQVAGAAESALRGELSEDQRVAVSGALGRLEAALRARALTRA